MIEQGLFALVTQNAAVQTAVGTDANGTTRAYWILAPQGAVIPFLVFSRVGTDDSYAMQGRIPLRGALCQIVSYASTYYASRAIAATVLECLEDYTGTLPDADATVVQAVIVEKDFDMNYEEGSKGFIYGAYLQFRIWYQG
jgi:hypothetical protein